MVNVRTGPDGSIIKDNEVIETNSGTIIREDGTIENVGGGNSASVRRSVMSPPVSPLEGRNNWTVNEQSYDVSVRQTQQNNSSGRTISELEYDIQIQEARVRGVFPKGAIIATCVLGLIALMGMYIMFIPAIVTGGMAVIGFMKRSELEAERVRMSNELANLQSNRTVR